MVWVIKQNGHMLPLSWCARNKNSTSFLYQTKWLLFFHFFWDTLHIQGFVKGEELILWLSWLAVEVIWLVVEVLSPYRKKVRISKTRYISFYKFLTKFIWGERLMKFKKNKFQIRKWLHENPSVEIKRKASDELLCIKFWN